MDGIIPPDIEKASSIEQSKRRHISYTFFSTNLCTSVRDNVRKTKPSDMTDKQTINFINMRTGFASSAKFLIFGFGINFAE